MGDSVGVGAGDAEAIGVGFGEGVGVGSAKGVGVGVDVGVTAGSDFFIATPLFQTSFVPDLTQVNFLPEAVAVEPTFVHLAPALGVAACTGAARASSKAIAIARRPLCFIRIVYRDLRTMIRAVVPAPMKKSASGTQPKIR